MSSLHELEQEALQAVAGAADAAALDQVRVHYLGKKGSLTQQLKQLGKLPAEERPLAGQEINRIKQMLGKAISARAGTLQSAALDAQLAGEKIDVRKWKICNRIQKPRHLLRGLFSGKKY